MFFNRLHVRGKLNLLILLPLSALLFVATPFVVSEAGSAESAASTAEAAHNAELLGNLIWHLQRERLLTAAYLVSADAGSDLRQQHAVVDAAARVVQAQLGSTISDELAGAMIRLGSVRELREAALQRGTSIDSVARAYHAVIQALIDALRLVPQRTSDAEGTRQLTALDALLNANEQSALRGMALIAAAVNPQTGLVLLADASSRAEQFIERFVEQADVGHASEVVEVELGDLARRVDADARTVPSVHGSAAVAAFAAEALDAVDALAKQRRPVQDRVTGEIADAAGRRADAARWTAVTLGVGTAILLVLVAVLTVTLSRSIARPLRRLTTAATDIVEVAGTELSRMDDEERDRHILPNLPDIEVSSGDEVGELARAFNRLQATAAQLVERQVVSRQNVNLMFTNVAQRTRNLVSRQLAVVDELERDEQNAKLLASLYRLDHLATRLRRNAENLLVLAGAQEEQRIKRPTSLVTLLRAAMTEIEDYQRVQVQVQAATDVVIGSGPASDLTLVFAELLENATSFSPPESAVEVFAEMTPAGAHCRVSIVDRGIGMKPQRLSEENQRLVERERLDVAPTNVLGLFVVGRLARRHGLGVRLRPTSGGGTTAEVVIPSALFHNRPTPAASHDVSGRHAAIIARRPVPPAVSAPATSDDGFRWFSRTPANGAPVAIPAAVSAAAPAAIARSVPPAVSGDAGYGAPRGIPPAAPAPPSFTPAPSTVGGGQATPELSRRVPGAHLAPGLRDRPPAKPRQPADPWRTRDPNDVRANFDSYTAAWQRAGAAPGTAHTREGTP